MKVPQGAPVELPPEGTHQFVLVSILDVGTQDVVYQDKTSQSRRVLVAMEITEPGIRKESGDPFIKFREYTFSEKSKNLLKDMKAWLGLKDLAEFDFDTLLGKHGAITISHSDDGKYANITNIAALMKGIKLVKAKTAFSSFYIDDENGIDWDEFKALPEWAQTKIAKSKEYPALVAEREQAASKAKGGKKAPAPAPKKTGKK